MVSAGRRCIGMLRLKMAVGRWARATQLLEEGDEVSGSGRRRGLLAVKCSGVIDEAVSGQGRGLVQRWLGKR